ncbi:MAG: TIGR03960 family B12-binding radical SAM protein, partial [Clostridiales bacterium]|nr:TIGR03960 family B12-binding radical SAM protein [Clostridiales bacterium]
MHRFLLPRVERPAQYIGGEYNSVVKDWEKTAVKMAFLFPETYEIGMSHLGLRLLYHAVNREENFLMERSFAPLPDMEAEMRSLGMPLFSWESRRPLRDFDVLGFTLQYELTYTNVLNMLDLAQLPLLSAERRGWPVVIAGGPAAYNPEPLADFIDLFVIGEGEEALPELLALLAEVKDGGGSKEDFLRQALQIEGVYVPAYYEVDYAPDGLIAAVRPLFPAPAVVRKRLVKDIEKAPFPEKGLLPHTRAVHDRAMLEIMRGCTRGCRFCQAGVIYRPVREKSLELLLQQAEKNLRSTGYDELGLMSLSSADYSGIEPLTDRLLQTYGPCGVGVSLPSLRADAFSVGLAEKVQRVRKSGLTFAPEAGTQRMRDLINKGVNEEEILQAVTAAAARGWTSVKLYFMIGLPQETAEDISGIAGLTGRLLHAMRRAKPPEIKKPLKITLGAATFVPKSHTPFQWQGQDTKEQIREKQALLLQAVRPMKAVTLNYHDVDASHLEAVFARGDRRLGAALLSAWRKGCRFDGSRERFQTA